MIKRIGLSPLLAKQLQVFPDVTQGGSFDFTIRLASENGGFWAVYEGRSSIITVSTIDQAVDVLARLTKRYKIANRTPTRTLLRQMREPEEESTCHNHPKVPVSRMPRRSMSG